MKCPICGAWSEVLETRAHADHVTRRQRECANKHRFVTMEVTKGAYSHARVSLERRASAPGRRITLHKRDQQIRSMLNMGHTVADAAAKYALSECQVRRIRNGVRTS